MKDHTGREITKKELPTTLITVWEIHPSLNSEYDYSVIREYQKAVAYAKDVLGDIMDDPETEFPATVTIKHSTMTLHDYEELQYE